MNIVFLHLVYSSSLTSMSYHCQHLLLCRTSHRDLAAASDIPTLSERQATIISDTKTVVQGLDTLKNEHNQVGICCEHRIWYMLMGCTSFTVVLCSWLYSLHVKACPCVFAQCIGVQHCSDNLFMYEQVFWQRFSYNVIFSCLQTY